VIVETEDLTVVFRRRFRRTLVALDGVNLSIREGDFFALLGPNGAGKSTALYCMLGLLRPSSGEARVFGRRLRPGCDEFRDIAYLPEEPHYHDYLTVEEAVTYYARLAGVDAAPPRVRDVLERLDIASARSTPVAACSKGMKQKVGIAHCLLHEPRLLFLDEPMRGLDPIATKDFRGVLLDLNHRGVTIVMNSHLLSEVELVANRAAILADGRVAAVDDVSALVDRGRDAAGRPRTLEDAFMAIVRKDSNAHA
jgi:ABC-2 type transport system ATP-binding protein